VVANFIEQVTESHQLNVLISAGGSLKHLTCSLEAQLV